MTLNKVIKVQRNFMPILFLCPCNYRMRYGVLNIWNQKVNGILLSNLYSDVYFWLLHNISFRLLVTFTIKLPFFRRQLSSVFTNLHLGLHLIWNQFPKILKEQQQNLQYIPQRRLAALVQIVIIPPAVILNSNDYLKMSSIYKLATIKNGISTPKYNGSNQNTWYTIQCKVPSAVTQMFPIFMVS